MNKPVYLGLSGSEISKVVTFEVRYDYTKPRHGDTKLSYVDTDSFIVYMET